MGNASIAFGLIGLAITYGPFAPAALAEEGDEAGAASGAPQVQQQPLQPPSRPAVRFGRAVDLMGADIEPESSAMGGPDFEAGAMPSGRPLAAGRLTSGFGMRGHPVLGGRRFHGGIDLAAATGTPVAATSSGVVLSAGWRGGYGILVRLSHGGTVETRYAHLSAVAVRAGDRVQAGQTIGYVGSTGRSTGPHLHYETRVDGRPVDPASLR
ncbi:M23 family metallopeptidase [Qipengyuania sp. 902]|uniref:M23 family metallopeptidase n=1 Tax=Qipengyuania sp. 902 TaxID=3417565 RepID=UPI003EBCC030